MLGSLGHEVSLWAHRADHAEAIARDRENKRLLPGITVPHSITVTHDIELALHGAPMVVTAIPSQYLRHTAKAIGGRDFSPTTFVNVAKGIENGSLFTMSQVLVDVIPSVRPENIVALSGPSFAEEVSRKVPTAVVAASPGGDAARAVQKAFSSEYFRIYSSEDLKGVELAGSLKNVFAIGAGIAEGAGFGDNTKAAILTRATAEISRLGLRLGAQPQTFAGLSGIGDLIATCLSKHSRNRHVGEELGRGRKLDDVLAEMIMVAEGVATTRSVRDLSRQVGVELPIANEIFNIIFEGKDPIAATGSLMTRDAKDET
jgi:glycerol-3-phosphate dehydrogenase (NAD(P)+)